MKAALLIVLSLSAMALAGPAFNKNQNDINKSQQQQQQTQYSIGNQNTDIKQTQAIETLKQWCFSSQMSQPELTSSFKKLVGLIKSQPTDESTESAVMSERICQGALVQKSSQSGETLGANGADVKAHELIKDVYMDALIACESRECTQQLLKIINSNKVDTIRASYYMTRLAVTEKDEIKDDAEIKQLAQQFIQHPHHQTSEAIERQKLFATSAVLGKYLKNKCERKEQMEQDLVKTVEQVAKTIVERFVKPVSQSEVSQYQTQQEQPRELIKKIAKRNAALKALANIPGCYLEDIKEVEETLIELVKNKQELVTVRQSAIECLNSNEQVYQQLKQVTFDQEEPIEVRVAALRTIMTIVSGDKKQQQLQKTQEIVEQCVKHCEDQRNQQQDDQFVLYTISYLENLRTSQQAEHKEIKETIAKNKQHYMQIQLLNKKFKQQLNDIRKSSRNYKLEQEFNQLESGLIVEGDLIYESKHKSQQQMNILPKLIRVNMSMPIMGETVNVIEVTLRQNQMDEELLSTLKMVKDAKFNSESVSKVVDSFKSSVEKREQYGNKKQENVEADLTIKVDGCTIVYLCVDDFKTTINQHTRNTRSVHYTSIVDEIIGHLKRNPIAFNRGFNFNFNERIAKALDVDANIIAGLRFESRASSASSSSKDFELVAQVEPRFAFEAIVGPAKLSSKKLMQRVSTKTAFGLRLRYKNNELYDVQVDLPMNTMELFTVETQMVEKSRTSPYSYTYLPESIYGQEDIYTPEEYGNGYDSGYGSDSVNYRTVRKMKRSIFESKKQTGIKSLITFVQGKQTTFARSIEVPESWARLVGMRGKLRMVASPKDMSFLAQAIVQKYEPSMQGFRFQVQKLERIQNGEQKQYVITYSTPGSRTDRTIQVRSVWQQNQQRTLVKAEVQTPTQKANMQLELVHDGRQYSIKTELVSLKQNQRHLFECGIQRGSQSQSGRIATSYKPYLNIESSSLRRPIQMQGVVSYHQQSPKTVISWDLKCPTTSDFVQGKFILDARSGRHQYSNERRSMQPQSSFFVNRRSMRSPLEMIFTNDLTFTTEFLAQVQEHAVKFHQMVDWSIERLALNADWTLTHKELRGRQHENQYNGQLKLDAEQQMVVLQRRCPQQARKDFRFQLQSEQKSKSGHQLVCELRYKQNLQSIVSYKHKIDVVEQGQRKFGAQYEIEVLASEYGLKEKLVGRSEFAYERRGMKVFRTEMSTLNKQKLVKVDFEFESLDKHVIELLVQGERQFMHKTLVRCDQRVASVQSRTEKQGQLLAKLVLEVMKQSQDKDTQLLIELPTKQVHCAVDMKLGSGKLSSWAIQTPRFVSKAEISFETIPYNKRSSNWIVKSMMPFNQLRFKTDLKDQMRQDAYWLDTQLYPTDFIGQWNPQYQQQQARKSYFRFDSPIYRSDFEFNPQEESHKFGLFARSKRSVNNYNRLYSQEDSILSQIMDEAQSKMNLGDKLWMVRSLIAPNKMESLKRALFEYADRRQQHRHQMQWSPVEDRLNLSFERQPNLDFATTHSIKPIRFVGDLSTKWQQQSVRPSKFSLESELVDFDFDMKPFDGEELFAKVNAVSRYPRSAWKKHESELRYKKNQGYKAHMKHQDQEDKHHHWQLEADESPKKWTKMSMESDKYGKSHYEHQWRKHMNKRSHHQDKDEQDEQDEDVYSNKVSFFGESPRKTWSHRTDFTWDEPMEFVSDKRHRRSISFDKLDQVSSEAQRRYNTIDYLKHVSARLNSQTMNKDAELYKIDFDYLPESHARLQMNLPNEMLHTSSFEYKPTERLYKLQSKLIDSRNKKPTYELLAQTKPYGASYVQGLATQDQEPVFIQETHPMLEQPISKRMALNLFKQPMKLDYSDKYGRMARLDYDQSPIVDATQEMLFGGLRQKRAAIYYKDEQNDFEHESSYDFYPESFLSGGFKKSQLIGNNKRYQNEQSFNKYGDFVTKMSTKYGPIVVRADSNGQTCELNVQTPIVNARLTGEESNTKHSSKLFKLFVDNKHQTVQLTKIVRKTPVIKELEPLVKLAQKFDSAHFEHQSELLISVVDSILKLKSKTMNNERPVLIVDGEFNKQQEKLIVKIDGERTSGQLVADLISGQSQLVLNVDDKRTLQHQTRLVRVENGKFYQLESMTSYKQQPLFKLTGKISSLVFTDPMHLFESHKYQSRYSQTQAYEHLSKFEATIFEPKRIQIVGQYNCLDKEAHLVFEDEDKKVSEVRVHFDERTNDVKLAARTSSPRGIGYQIQKTFKINPLVNFVY